MFSNCFVISVSELKLTLFSKVKVEYFISKRTHKLNASRFWVKIWCQTHLYCCFEPIADYPSAILSFADYPSAIPTVVSESIVLWRDRSTHCIESFSDRGGQRASFIKYSGNDSASVGWKSFRLRGSKPNILRF
jgi:hypothetical protein